MEERVELVGDSRVSVLIGDIVSSELELQLVSVIARIVVVAITKIFMDCVRYDCK
jgi:hypothetical protein